MTGIIIIPAPADMSTASLLFSHSHTLAPADFLFSGSVFEIYLAAALIVYVLSPCPSLSELNGSPFNLPLFFFLPQGDGLNRSPELIFPPVQILHQIFSLQRLLLSLFSRTSDNTFFRFP